MITRRKAEQGRPMEEFGSQKTHIFGSFNANTWTIVCLQGISGGIIHGSMSEHAEILVYVESGRTLVSVSPGSS